MGRKGQAQAGDFDVYLLAQSWAPRFCCGHPDKCSTVSWAFSATHLSLHGLWPGYTQARGGQTYPMNCASKAKLVVSDLPRHFVDIAPSYCGYNTERHAPELGSLGIHEWQKHGTCTSLEPSTYFTEAVRVVESLSGPAGAKTFDRGTPKVVLAKLGSSDGVPANELRLSYAKHVGVRVDKNCRLEEVTTCWAKQPDGSVGEQVHCPEHVLKSPRNNIVDGACQRVLVTKLGQCLAGELKRAQAAAKAK
jgi:ribonuclease T2